MKEHILPAFKLTLICMVFFLGFYTIVVWGIAQAAPNHGKGEIIVHGSQRFCSNIGQAFTGHKYFWPRPSAVGYNAAGSGGSNKGPSNPDYLAQVQARIDTFLVHNPGIDKSEIPADLVTASGAGLDPNISVQAALVQVKRIAKARNIMSSAIESLIAEHTEKPLLNLFGTEKINVLKLNIDLDKIK